MATMTDQLIGRRTTTRWPNSTGIAGVSDRFHRWPQPISGRRSVRRSPLFSTRPKRVLHRLIAVHFHRSVRHSPLFSTHSKRVLLCLIPVHFVFDFSLLTAPIGPAAPRLRPFPKGIEVVLSPHIPCGCWVDFSLAPLSASATDLALHLGGMKSSFVDFVVGRGVSFSDGPQAGDPRHAAFLARPIPTRPDEVAGEPVSSLTDYKRVADGRTGGMRHRPSGRKEARQSLRGVRRFAGRSARAGPVADLSGPVCGGCFLRRGSRLVTVRLSHPIRSPSAERRPKPVLRSRWPVPPRCNLH